MTHLSSTFPSELGIASRVGMTRGVGAGSTLGSFAEAEMHYREERLVADVLRRRREDRGNRKSAAARTRREGMSRWTTWLLSVPMHRSSHVPQSSSGCGN